LSVTGLLRTEAEIWRAAPSTGDTGEVEPGYAFFASARCTAQPARGRAVRTAAGELVEADVVAYFPEGTDLRPGAPGEMPDRVRLAGCDYVCVFVVRGPGRGSPVRAGLRAPAGGDA
jgi:hypothetical protein